MLIFMMLFGTGVIVTVLGLWWLARGISSRDLRLLVVGLSLPLVYWTAFWALWDADRRFIEEEARKNGGQLPEWVW